MVSNNNHFLIKVGELTQLSFYSKHTHAVILRGKAVRSHKVPSMKRQRKRLPVQSICSAVAQPITRETLNLPINAVHITKVPFGDREHQLKYFFLIFTCITGTAYSTEKT